MSVHLLPEPGPLTPDELLACTPREAALLEALRGMFHGIGVDVAVDPPYILARDFNVPFCAARGAYLTIRRQLAEVAR